MISIISYMPIHILILKRFGSVKQAKTATLETLQETVGAAKAKILFEFWHDETDN